MFVGGLVRGLVDWRRNRGPELAALAPAERVAAGDRGDGVLLASGYIAGGALAGIFIAFSAGVFEDFDRAVHAWAQAANPFYAGAHADLLTLLPFGLLVACLFWIARRDGTGDGVAQRQP
jgi:hypothetical protein